MKTTFAAQAFCDALPNGRAAGTLSVTPHGIAFTSDEGSVVLPLRGLDVEAGGAANRVTFFTHAEHEGWTVFTSEESVVDAPAFAAEPSALAKVQGVRAQRRRRSAGLWLVLALVLALCGAVALGLARLPTTVAKHLPPEWEEELGDAAFAQLSLELTLLEDAATDAALEALMAPLEPELAASDVTWEFYVADEEELNAMALPGGIIVVHSGLILAAEDGDEVLAVLAHELTHVTEQHSVRRLIKTMGTFVLLRALVGDAPGVLADVAAMAPFLLAQSYSRGYERDADAGALRIMNDVGLDPAAMATMFGRFAEREAELTAEGMDVPNWLRTHPATDQRIAFFEDAAAEASGPFLDTRAELLALQDAVRAAQFARVPRHDSGSAETGRATAAEADAPAAAPEKTP